MRKTAATPIGYEKKDTNMKTASVTGSGRQRQVRFSVPVAGNRKLVVILATDLSGSMSQHGKIEAVNYAMASSLRQIEKIAKGKEGVDVEALVIGFGAAAEVVLGPASIESISWQKLSANQPDTLAGPAIDLMIDRLDAVMSGRRGLPPVLALVSDGLARDKTHWQAAVTRLSSSKWGQAAIRVGVGISGVGGECDLELLTAFIGNPERPPLVASDAAQLGDFIEWSINSSFNQSLGNGPDAPLQFPNLPSLPFEDDDDEEDDA